MMPQIKQLGSTTFLTNGILDGEETAPDISTWLYKEPPPKSEELDHLKKKYPRSHHLAIEKWDCEGGGLGHLESRIR